LALKESLEAYESRLRLYSRENEAEAGELEEALAAIRRKKKEVRIWILLTSF